MSDVVAVTVRQSIASDIKMLIELTREAGWDYTEFDCLASLAIDPEGLLVAEDTSGNPVGFVGVWNMSANVWFVSAYIVRKELRRHGIGNQLWSAMLNRTQGCKNLILESVVATKDWYTKQGFVYEAFKVYCFKGRFDTVDMTTDVGAVCIVTQLSQELWPLLLDYDREVYPYCREWVLHAWFRGQESHTVVALSDGNVTGYGNFHKENDTEYHIRALYGNNDAIAETILSSMIETVPKGSTFHFQLISDKTLPKVFSGFKSNATCYRMFTNACPGIKTNKIYMNSPSHL